MKILLGHSTMSYMTRSTIRQEMKDGSFSIALGLMTPCVCFLLFFSASCTPGIATLDCTTDEECVEEFGEEYQTCGNSETEGTVCCQAGTEKCPCLEDNTCLYDLVCYEQDLGDTYPQGRFCNYEFVEPIPGLDRVE